MAIRLTKVVVAIEKLLYLFDFLDKTYSSINGALDHFRSLSHENHRQTIRQNMKTRFREIQRMESNPGCQNDDLLYYRCATTIT